MQTRPSPWLLPKAKALGIDSWEIPTFGLGIPAFLANSATCLCNSGSSFSETYFTLIIMETIEGPTRY